MICCDTPGCQSFDVAALLKHAGRFGTDCVYSTAEEHRLDVSDLGRLPVGLRAVDRRWRLEREQAERLVNRLVSAGSDEGQIAKFTGLSTKSVQTLMDPSLRSLTRATEPRERENGPTRPLGRTRDMSRLGALCGACGEKLVGRRSDARFCDATCRQAAKRKATA